MAARSRWRCQPEPCCSQESLSGWSQTGILQWSLLRNRCSPLSLPIGRLRSGRLLKSATAIFLWPLRVRRSWFPTIRPWFSCLNGWESPSHGAPRHSILKESGTLMPPHSFLTLLQFADGLFPAGAYAHSFGLECYVQQGMIRDAGGVREFLESYLESSAGPEDAVAMAHCIDLARDGHVGEVLDIDQALEAMKPAAELRQASRQMGRQSLRVAASLTDDRYLMDLFRRVESRETPGHYAMAFGAIGGRLGWPRKEAACAFLYSAAAAVVGSGLRLIPLGQLQGQ